MVIVSISECEEKRKKPTVENRGLGEGWTRGIMGVR